MADRIRFHLDENVNPAIAQVLRQRGIDVTTAVDSGLRTSSDPDHLAFALSEGRVIVTHDDDFLILASLGQAHAGIAYCKQNSRSIGDVVRSLMLIYEVLTAEEMVGQIEYL